MMHLWHALSVEKTLEALATSFQGLSSAEITTRQNQYGRNILPVAKAKSVLRIFFEQFLSPLIYLLMAAGVLSYVMHERVDAYFIFGIIGLNTLIGTFQAYRAERSVQNLQHYVANQVRVVRAGKEQTIMAEDLVPGDVVVLVPGQKIAADMRLIQGHEIRVDESLLTGESLAVEKHHNAQILEGAPLADRFTMLHAGTTLENGAGYAVVVATGSHTALGDVAKALSGKGFAPPPMIQKMQKFATRLTFAAIGLMVLLAAALLLQGQPFATVFMVVTALAVSAVPEGLPVALTVAMAVGVRRLAGRKVIVRGLPAVEGLGACGAIYTDKTGTLTLNNLTAQVVWIPHKKPKKDGPLGEHVLLKGVSFDASKRKLMRRLAMAGVLCNEASIENGKPTGDSVDTALMRFGTRMMLDRPTLLRHLPRIAQVPFESANQYAASFHQFRGKTLAAVKGAPEVIAKLCGDPKAPWLQEVQNLADGGYKVLAFAGGEVKNIEGLQNLTFLGLVALVDPPRPEAADAVAKCRIAGVDVAMITGDHPSTALNIAKELGIAARMDEVVIGSTLAPLNPKGEEFLTLVRGAKVFARVTPVQKQQIVEAALADGRFVAVTGDGVNDAPALKMAHIGVAMGQNGTDIARDAADLVLTDDNFASLVAGVEEGRLVYANIRKVVNLLVTAGAAEIMTFVLSLAMGLPLPLTAVQLLWLNVVTDGIQDKSLAFEPAEKGLMRKNPRPQTEGIFNRPMVAQILFNGTLMGVGATLVFWYAQTQMALSVEDARNLTLLAMVLFENVYLFVARSETRFGLLGLFKNPWAIGAAVMAQGVHLLAMYVPPLQTVLETGPVSFAYWQYLLLMALGIFMAAEAFKVVVRKL